MTKVSKVSAVETSNVATEIVAATEKRNVFENGILLVSGYRFDSNTGELQRKGKVTKNVMPRFHDVMIEMADKYNLPGLAALCVAGRTSKEEVVAE